MKLTRAATALALASIGMTSANMASAEPPAAAESAAELLTRIWPGVRDSSERVVVSTDRGLGNLPDNAEQRVRTVVARVSIPWLGPRVLYLEEFLHDDPGTLRRQVLLQVERDEEDAARSVRIHPFAFRNPAHWRELHRNPRLLAAMGAGDIYPVQGAIWCCCRKVISFAVAPPGTNVAMARVGPSVTSTTTS